MNSSKIKIISIKKDNWGNMKTMEIISKFKNMQKVNFLICDEYFSEEYILNYLKKIYYGSN